MQTFYIARGLTRIKKGRPVASESGTTAEAMSPIERRPAKNEKPPREREALARMKI
jgi:hypothetical protein